MVSGHQLAQKHPQLLSKALRLIQHDEMPGIVYTLHSYVRKSPIAEPVELVCLVVLGAAKAFRS